MELFGCKNIVFSSSTTIYGSVVNNFIDEDSEIKPINPYGKTKSIVESLLKDLYQCFPSEWSIANLVI